MKTPPSRHFRPFRLESLERWIALAVAMVVGLGVLGESYQQYLGDSWSRNIHLRGLDYESWGDLVITDEEFGAEHAKSGSDMPYGSVPLVDGVINLAIREGADVGAYRYWSGLLTNPDINHALEIDGGLMSTSIIAATAGIDWQEFGLVDQGREPEASGEIALANWIAEELGVGIGDTVVGSSDDKPDAFEFTVVGLLKDPFTWILGDSRRLFTESGGYGALAYWGDSAALTSSLETRPPGFLWTEIFWNGDSPTLDSFAPSRREDDSSDIYGWWYPGPRLISAAALALGGLALVTAAILGRGKAKATFAWRTTPARLLITGSLIAAASAAAALLASLATNVFFDLRYSQLVQTPYRPPPADRLLFWLGIGVALALLLGLVAWLRGCLRHRLPTFLAMAHAVGRALRPRWWKVVIAAVALAVFVARPWIDDSMEWTYFDPSLAVIIPIGVLLSLGSMWLAFTSARWAFGTRRSAAVSPSEARCVAAIGIAATLSSVFSLRYALRATVDAKLGLDSIFGSLDLEGITGAFGPNVLVLALAAFLALSLAGRGSPPEKPPRRSPFALASAAALAVGAAGAVGFLAGAFLQFPVEWRNTYLFDLHLHDGSWAADVASYLGLRLAIAVAVVAAVAGLATLAHALGERYQDRRVGSPRPSAATAP